MTSHWDDHPDHPVSDWQYEVASGDTRQSYSEWVASKRTDHFNGQDHVEEYSGFRWRCPDEECDEEDYDFDTRSAAVEAVEAHFKEAHA